jgi:hypothetical protein
MVTISKFLRMIADGGDVFTWEEKLLKKEQLQLRKRVNICKSVKMRVSTGTVSNVKQSSYRYGIGAKM